MNISYYFENSPVHISITANNPKEIDQIIDRFLDCAYLAEKSTVKSYGRDTGKRDPSLSDIGGK
jgi:hypothetical protein